MRNTALAFFLTLKLFQAFFVSSKTDQLNLRKGPGKVYPISVQINAKNYPLDVIDTFEHWYKVRDFEGEEGWVFKNLTSKEKYIICINDKSPAFFPHELNKPRFIVEKGVILPLLSDKDSEGRVKTIINGEKVLVDGKDYYGH